MCIMALVAHYDCCPKFAVNGTMTRADMLLAADIRTSIKTMS